MNPSQSGAATLPKGFRYRQADYRDPKTPEPFSGAEDVNPPSPPRPRFKLKRRNVANLLAPTQHFLASVAAADVPIPSIEEPEFTAPDEEMVDTHYPVIPQLRDLEELAASQKIRGRTFSPPRTPAPGAAPSLSPRRYPNWSIDSAFSSSESSPECESSRPSTARSTQTSGSLFSRFSLVSDDMHCISPEAESGDLFKQSSVAEDVAETAEVAATSKSTRKLRKAPWTKAMSQHLWSTYLMYLQDPKVTPFRTGKSCIPPHGVCSRVAREAKKSWRGSKAQTKTPVIAEDKSGSSTPTLEAAGTFIQWPHTCAATRNHLRELCKLKATSAVRNGHFMSHSPTPFGRTATRYWNRRSTPARSPSVFSAQDMAMSLAISTSETMKPEGALAQLTSSVPEDSDMIPDSTQNEIPSTLGVPSTSLPRLGSPFIASYGPSSSGALLAGLSLMGSTHPRETHTVGPRRSLQSPVRLTRSRSTTQKRRTRQSSQGPRRSKRPSLASDLWTDPSSVNIAQPENMHQPSQELEFSSTNSTLHDELFVPRTNIEELLPPAPPAQLQPPVTQESGLAMSALPLPDAPPPRLGSPFSASSSSFSFPNRFTQLSSLEFGTVRRPFATIHQSRNSAPVPARTNLATRLAYIDQRLRELRHRDSDRRRSESPF
jgi:hypothetical protein